MIIPSRRSSKTLPRTLRSLEAAAAGLDVETVVVEDAEGRGAGWARNRGLDRATGEAVFFCDDDDEVEKDFFRRPLARLSETSADLCIFQYAASPLKRDYELKGNAAVREAMLPAFFGYSFDDVRRWNAGGDLYARREPGSVCRCAFRRDFIERCRLRFPEGIYLYEDALFLSACALRAERVTSLRENLYRYLPNPEGTTATVTNGERHWQYKFAALELRKRLAAVGGPEVWRQCEASCVFSALELLRHGRGARRFASDPAVAAALRGFPISWRHPMVAAGVTWLRTF